VVTLVLAVDAVSDRTLSIESTAAILMEKHAVRDRAHSEPPPSPTSGRSDAARFPTGFLIFFPRKVHGLSNNKADNDGDHYQ